MLRSGLVDTEFYAAQRGWASGSAHRAVRDYVVRGFREGLSVNPLFDELVAGRSLPEPDRVPALYAYLLSDRRSVRVHPWWDSTQGPSGPHPPLERVWGEPGASVQVRVGPIERRIPLDDLRRWAIEAVRSRGAAQPSAASREHDHVVRLLQRRDRDYPERLALAARLTGTARVTVGMVGAEPGQWVAGDILRRLADNVDLREVHARATYADAVSQCASPSAEGVMCVVGPRSDLSADQVRALLGTAQRGVAAGPVELAGDGTVHAVGAAGVGARVPVRLLGGHPAEDAGSLPARLSVPLLSGPTFAVHGSDWGRVGGFASVDRAAPVEGLTSLLRSSDPGYRCLVRTEIVSTSWARNDVFRRDGDRLRRGRYADDRRDAAEVYESAGFEVRGWVGRGSKVRPELAWRRPDPDALRWSIRISAPPGPAGAVWGDTHFAHGLADALRRRGHEAVIDSHAARNRTSAYLDDVTLVVRGPYRTKPPRRGVRMLWVISHPDQITRREVSEFDIVYAASQRWSRVASERWGIDVRPLLECTDAERFRPRGLARTDEIVFVGTARGIARPSVVVPIAAGIPVRVYGPDWRTYIPASAIVAESIPHAELSARYETASIVLNDQWPAMQREGFMAMRPFDAVAAGGRVISEYVDGIEEVFGEAVPVFRSPDELLELLRRDPDDLFPDAAGLRTASERIRREHSFDARADELIEAARRGSVLSEERDSGR